MEEGWKDIANFEGLYQVSNLGRVKSLPKVGSGGHNGITLSQSKDKDGYLLVYLYANRKKVACKVHRLVAKAFIPNPNNFPQVNHKDEVKDNIVREFNSAKEAESTLGFNSSNITNCCKGKYKSMYGYKWKYKQ